MSGGLDTSSTCSVPLPNDPDYQLIITTTSEPDYATLSTFCTARARLVWKGNRLGDSDVVYGQKLSAYSDMFDDTEVEQYFIAAAVSELTPLLMPLYEENVQRLNRRHDTIADALVHSQRLIKAEVK
jgi:hypothetical protein